MSSVYQINKGINRPIEFKGFKAQYIWWLGGGMMIVIFLYMILYFLDVNTYVSVGFALIAGAVIFYIVQRMSNKYGEFGMMKMMSKKSVPESIISKSRKVFIKE